MGGFYQDPPRLENQFTADRLLRSYLRRKMPAEMLREVEADLTRFADRLFDDIAAMAADAEAHPPQLVQFDPWGRRIDHIELARGWHELEAVAAEEGLIAAGYERRQGPFSRLYQFTKLYLYNPSSAVATCPLAMADGAARLIEVMGDDELRTNAFRRLTSRDPAEFWTSGQWMTERTGGSDVGRTETIARADGDRYRLYGTKWFTSSTTSQMTMTLARIEPPGEEPIAGSRGLSLFYLETRNADGGLNDIVIHRLKDKLGTRALPTAELSLEGTTAKLIGEPGRGVPNIATLVNVTRMYNTVSSVGSMRRGLALARDYAHRREAFGKPLAEHPLHLETLAELEVQWAATFVLAMHATCLMGKEECGEATADEAAELRLLTPICKLYTAKQCVAAASEVLECFGGAGYVEDTGLPKLLRDSQVLPIWEGTTNVLSLDCLRAIAKEDALRPTLATVQQRVAAVDEPTLAEPRRRIEKAVEAISQYVGEVAADGRPGMEAGARRFAYALSRTISASLLLEHAAWALADEGDGRWAEAARRYARQDLAPLQRSGEADRGASRALALEEDLPSQSAASAGRPMTSSTSPARETVTR